MFVEQTSRSIPTPRAYQPLRVEVTFQPDEADAIVHELGNRELNQRLIISHLARWLHMSQTLKVAQIAKLKDVSERTVYNALAESD